MSDLGDQIIEHGPYVAGDVVPFTVTTAAAMNEFRNELIALRAMRDRRSFHDTKPDWHFEEMRAKAAAARPTSTLPARQPSAGGPDGPEGAETISGGSA